MTALIEFRKVAKAYRSSRASKVILREFSGEFPRGRNIGLLGLNGAGKSTMLRLIAGTEYPDRGIIKRNVRVSFPLGFTGSFKSTLSGRENCRFVARIYGFDVRRVERFVEEFAQLGKYFEMPLATYSSGMRARISFGLSMALDFECYLIDEGLSVGDSTFKARATAMFAAKREKASLIVVSHSASTIRRYCDMGAVLGHGELQLYDNLEDAIAEYQRLCGNIIFSE